MSFVPPGHSENQLMVVSFPGTNGQGPRALGTAQKPFISPIGQSELKLVINEFVSGCFCFKSLVSNWLTNFWEVLVSSCPTHQGVLCMAGFLGETPTKVLENAGAGRFRSAGHRSLCHGMVFCVPAAKYIYIYIYIYICICIRVCA